MIVVPSLITLLSVVLRLGFLLGWLPPSCGFFGIALDAADGWTARRFDVCTAFGAELDWHADTAAATVAILVWCGYVGPSARVALLGGLVMLLCGWAQNKATARRMSLSAPLVASVALARWFGASV